MSNCPKTITFRRSPMEKKQQQQKTPGQQDKKPGQQPQRPNAAPGKNPTQRPGQK